MLTFTEIFPPTTRLFFESIVSLNETLLESVLSAAGAWTNVHYQLTKSLFFPTTYSAVHLGSDTAVPPMSSDAQPDESLTPEQQPHPRTDMPNAAVAILSNPALAAGLVPNEEIPIEPEEVRDDVADDIAVEIQREAVIGAAEAESPPFDVDLNP